MAGITTFKKIVEKHGNEAKIGTIIKQLDGSITVNLHFPDGFEKVFDDYGSDISIFQRNYKFEGSNDYRARLIQLDDYCGAILIYNARK